MASAAKRWRYRSRPSKAVQGRPPAVRPLDTVGHHQMGVQQRVTFPGSPVVEADRQQPPTLDMLVSAVAAARPQVLIQVGDCLADAGVLGGQGGPASRRVAEAVE